MAEIDNSNPLSPVWPQRPIRRVEEGEKSSEGPPRRREEKRKEEEKKKPGKDDDGSPHIDEYA